MPSWINAWLEQLILSVAQSSMNMQQIQVSSCLLQNIQAKHVKKIQLTDIMECACKKTERIAKMATSSLAWKMDKSKCNIVLTKIVPQDAQRSTH